MTAAEALSPPREASALFGHGAAERTLVEAVQSGRLPHAWLFAGPPGIGKATLAFRFARYLLAGAAQDTGLFGDAPVSLALPEDHPTFRRVASGGHADLLTVERPPAETKDKGAAKRVRDLPIDQVRRIAPFLRMTPAEGGWRVVILDEAERMNRHGANAVLKVLEEPPPRALIVMVANNPGALLPTIRSRCRLLRLSPLPEETVRAVLQQAAPEMPDADRHLLARLAEGSLGRALALLDDDGLALYRTLIDMLATLPEPDLVAVHALGDRLSAPGSDRAWQTTTELLLGWLERLVRANVRPDWPGDPTDDDLTGGDAMVMRRLAESHGLDRLLELWDKTSHLVARTEGANLDRKQTVLAVFAALAAGFRP